MSSLLVALVVIGVSLVTAVGAHAQPRSAAGDDERERTFVEQLRREDPSVAERYVTLRDARSQAITTLERAEAQYRAVGPELRAGFVGKLREAQREYARASLALLDFLDARDRQSVTTLQEEIGRINRLLEERARTRARLEDLLKP